MTVIRSKDYGETEDRLMADPIVIAMSKGLKDVALDQMHHGEPERTARFEFMQAANAEYRKRGGKDGGHMGAVANALINLVLQDRAEDRAEQ
jgi:hypothetical protein